MVVISLHVGTRDLAHIRFAFSPLWETVASVRSLQLHAHGRLHEPWVRAVGPRLHDVDLALLTALVRPTGYVPDFLVPSPESRSPTFDEQLAQLAATPPKAAAAQIEHLAGHAVAQAGPGLPQRQELMHRLLANPATALRRTIESLRDYWTVAVEPHWPRVQALLQADLEYRLDGLAAGGVDQVLRTLHPAVTFDGDVLRIEKYYTGSTVLAGRGLLLVPCAFAWPDVIVLTAEPYVPTLSYSPRGLGRLWQRAGLNAPAALGGVLGTTRALLLTQLDLPMSTTQLAAQLHLTAPSVSAHLKALQATGLLSVRRDGRHVLYARTPVADALLASGESGRAQA